MHYYFGLFAMNPLFYRTLVFTEANFQYLNSQFMFQFKCTICPAFYEICCFNHKLILESNWRRGFSSYLSDKCHCPALNPIVYLQRFSNCDFFECFRSKRFKLKRGQGTIKIIRSIISILPDEK